MNIIILFILLLIASIVFKVEAKEGQIKMDSISDEFEHNHCDDECCDGD